MFHWPPLVLAALADDDVELAERLMEPVTEAQEAVAPYLVAQRHRLRRPDPGCSRR